MSFSAFPNVFISTSTTKHGNMSFVKGGAKDVVGNRKMFLKSIELDFKKIVALIVEHSGKVVVVSKQDLGRGAQEFESAFKADAVITKDENVFLFLLTADCLPIYFFDSKSHALGLAHASRKNVRKIIKNTVNSFIKEFRTDPRNLHILIGPSIGPCHYKMDLWKTAENELLKKGVTKENIENTRICTFEAKDFYSHRRAIEKLEDDFRFANIIGIK